MDSIDATAVAGRASASLASTSLAEAAAGDLVGDQGANVFAAPLPAEAPLQLGSGGRKVSTESPANLSESLPSDASRQLRSIQVKGPQAHLMLSGASKGVASAAVRESLQGRSDQEPSDAAALPTSENYDIVQQANNDDGVKRTRRTEAFRNSVQRLARLAVASRLEIREVVVGLEKQLTKLLDEQEKRMGALLSAIGVEGGYVDTDAMEKASSSKAGSGSDPVLPENIARSSEVADGPTLQARVSDEGPVVKVINSNEGDFDCAPKPLPGKGVFQLTRTVSFGGETRRMLKALRDSAGSVESDQVRDAIDAKRGSLLSEASAFHDQDGELRGSVTMLSGGYGSEKSHRRRSDNQSRSSKLSAHSKRTSEMSNARSARMSMESEISVGQRSMQSATTSAAQLYKLLPAWKELEDELGCLSIPAVSQNPAEARRASLGASQVRTSGLTRNEQTDVSGMKYGATVSLGAHDPTPMFSRFVMEPISWPRMSMDFLGCCFLIYDLVVLPLTVFNPPWQKFMLVGNLVVGVFWTLDMIACFFIGFHVDGKLEIRRGPVIRHYLFRWFPLDFILVSVDWTLLILDAVNEGASTHVTYMKAGRGVRAFRIVRLLRLIKVPGIINRVIELMNSEYLQTFAAVMTLLLLIVVVNHFIACIWYGIGNAYDTDAWVFQFFDANDDLAFRYTTSLHWSLTQFTPASMEVHATNNAERIFSVFILLCGLVMFSSFISAITEAMTHLRISGAKRRERQNEARRYFGENSISVKLQARVWRYCEQLAKRKHRRKMWQDVAIFQELPRILQQELHKEVYLPILLGHPFFRTYNLVSPLTMRAICNDAISEVSVASAQGLFDWGQPAADMYWIIDGKLDYFEKDEVFDNVWMGSIEKGQWASEAALWLKWFHTGVLTAKEDSMILALKATACIEIMRQYADGVIRCLAYAKLFVDSYNRNEMPLHDLAADMDAVESMVMKAFMDPFRQSETTLRSSDRSSVNLSDTMRYVLSSSSMKGKQMASWVSKVTNYALRGLGSRSFNYSDGSPESAPRRREQV